MDILEEIESWNLKTAVTLSRKALERAVVLSADATLDGNLEAAIADLDAARVRINTLDAA